MYRQYYPSPLGIICLTADDAGLCGLCFTGDAPAASPAPSEREAAAVAAGVRWLDYYFSGRRPDFLPSARPSGWPYGGAFSKFPTGKR